MKIVTNKNIATSFFKAGVSLITGEDNKYSGDKDTDLGDDADAFLNAKCAPVTQKASASSDPSVSLSVIIPHPSPL